MKISILLVALAITAISAAPSRHEIVAPKGLIADLQKIAAQAITTATEVQAAVSAANDKLTQLVGEEGPAIAQKLKEIADQAAAQAEQILKKLVKDLLTAPAASRPDLIHAALGDLQLLAQATKTQVEDALANVAAEVLPQVQEIVRELEENVNAAVEPLVALLEQLVNSPAIAQLVAQVKKTVADVEAALENAAAQLEPLLVGSGSELAAKLEQILGDAKGKAEARLRQLEADLVGATLAEAVELVKAALADLEQLAQQTAAEVEAAVSAAAGEALPEVERILAELEGRVKAAVDELVKVIEGLARH